jgi:hypothetical protein
MAVTKVAFTPAAATKIATVVKQVLNEPIDLRGRTTLVRTRGGSIQQPQYQWMVIGAISQNQVGAFFTPAVSMSMT